MSILASKSSRLMLAAAVLLSCVGCDQATKRMAEETLRGAPPRTYLSNTLRLEYALNPGGFLSLGSKLSPNVRFWVFTVVNALLLIFVAVFLARRWDWPLVLYVSLTCVFAGGVGNLIDRMLNNGLVTDFIILGIGPLRTGVFNVADVAITVGGCVLLFFAVWRGDAVDAVAEQPS